MVTRVSGERNSNTPPRRQHSRLNLLPPSYSLLSEAIFPDPYLYLSLYISLSRCLIDHLSGISAAGETSTTTNRPALE